MIRLLHSILTRMVIKSNRLALRGQACPHSFTTFWREEGKWSKPKPHPHPHFADRLTVITRESRERCRCLVCGVDILDRPVTDIKDASGNA